MPVSGVLAPPDEGGIPDAFETGERTSPVILPRS
jgi:hypothetical protein